MVNGKTACQTVVAFLSFSTVERKPITFSSTNNDATLHISFTHTIMLGRPDCSTFRYDGEWKNGHKHGRGIMKFAEGIM